MSTIGTLRAISDSELELMLAWRNAPAIRANMYTQHEIGIEEHRRWWAGILGSTAQQYFMYALADRPLGIVAFNNIDVASENAFWAFYSSPDAPRGTGVKMEFLALEHAFNALALHKLQCEVLAFNTQVIKLHQRFGFKAEGVFREQRKIDGKFVDVHRLGLLKSEWCERRPGMEAKTLALN